MNFKSIAAFAAIILGLLSCGNENDKDTRMISKNSEQYVESMNKNSNELTFNDSIKTPPVQARDNIKADKEKDVKENFIDWDKKIIKTADLKVETRDYKMFNGKVRTISKKYGGYISNEEQSQDEIKIENNLSIKIPVAQFEDAINELTDIAEKVTTRKISSDDVTTEIVDTKSRIEAKKQVRDKYLEFLKEAKNMPDVLTMQSEVNGIQEQLETASGRVEYLNHGAAYSTINLTYFQLLNAELSEVKPASFTGKAGIAFSKGLNFIKELAVGLLSVWPLFLVVLLIWGWYKKNKAAEKKQPSKTE
ncbi:MAG: DUF4349 domain-containing protein [Ferruginibacter sp.]